MKSVRNTKISSLLIFLVTVSISVLIISPAARTQTQNRSDITGSLSGDVDPGFKKAISPREFKFPEDSGPHPEYQTEWWYYTGNLEDKSGRRFGYQLTFFRRAISPETVDRESGWATNQIYFAHFTVSDSENKKFFSAERWSRAALGMAGAQADPHKVWTRDWSANKEDGVFDLRAGDREFSIDLKLTQVKPTVFHGERGLSQKGPEPGNASYYYAITRLETTGIIEIAGNEFQVQGLSWLDREWSTSVLGEDLKGWDWFSIQLDDGREIMLYQLRGKDGSVGELSAGAYIDKTGVKTNLKKGNFEIKALETWKSPDTGITYPSKWRVRIPEYDLELTVTPYQNNQELNLSFIYWEGAVEVSGEGVSGSGYVELTGY